MNKYVSDCCGKPMLNFFHWSAKQMKKGLSPPWCDDASQKYCDKCDKPCQPKAAENQEEKEDETK